MTHELATCSLEREEHNLSFALSNKHCGHWVAHAYWHAEHTGTLHEADIMGVFLPLPFVGMVDVQSCGGIAVAVLRSW